MNTGAQRLSEWYSEQCNNEWEHSYGIKIATVDNPGWHVEIELEETPWQNVGNIYDRRNAEGFDWEICDLKGRITLIGITEKEDALDGLLNKLCDVLDETKPATAL